jgi:hypothetical protein
VNLPTFNLRRANGDGATATLTKDGDGSLSPDEHLEQTRLAQREADRWLIVGTLLMGTMVLGLVGLPIFLRGVWLLRRAARSGLSVRPVIVTLIANHSLVARFVLTAWGNCFDAGYFWHYNELWIGGAGAPGEKAWEVALILTVFTMRIAAGIAFLQMKRWGHQWLIITCWMGIVIWIGYTFNMTMYADVRYAGVVFPVVGWWLYDIFYITPFLAIPYLHTVNREIFSD